MSSRHANSHITAILALFSVNAASVAAHAQDVSPVPNWTGTLTTSISDLNSYTFNAVSAPAVIMPKLKTWLDESQVSLSVSAEAGLVPATKITSIGHVVDVTELAEFGTQTFGLIVGHKDMDIVGGLNFRQNIAPAISTLYPQSIAVPVAPLAALPQTSRNQLSTGFSNLAPAQQGLVVRSIAGTIAQSLPTNSTNSVVRTLARDARNLTAQQVTSILRTGIWNADLTTARNSAIAQYGSAPFHVRGHFDSAPVGYSSSPLRYLEVSSTIGPAWGALRADGVVLGVTGATNIPGVGSIPQLGGVPYSASSRYIGIESTVGVKLKLIQAGEALTKTKDWSDKVDINILVGGSGSILIATGGASAALPAKQIFGYGSIGGEVKARFNSNAVWQKLGLGS